MLLFFIWAALKASFSALLTFSHNPRAINVYRSNMEKWATFPVNWYIVISKVFILCVSHKKSKLKEVKHCQRPHWRNRGLCYSVWHWSRWKNLNSPAAQHLVCAGWGIAGCIAFVQQTCDTWWAGIDSLRVWGWHFKKKKVIKREVSEFLGFNPFSNVLLDLTSWVTFSCQCCKTVL